METTVYTQVLNQVSTTSDLHSIEDLISNPGRYEINVFGCKPSGIIISKDGKLLDAINNKEYHQEDIWNISIFEEETPVTYKCIH